VLAAFGFHNEEKAPEFREGVKYLADKRTDIFFITLNKSDKDFYHRPYMRTMPSTSDYSIGRRRVEPLRRRILHSVISIIGRQVIE
jgi:hypothetical protein